MVAVIIILAAGWAVGVGPALSAANESDTQLADVEIQNQVKAAELARLKALDEDSAALFAELEDLQRAIPAVHNTSVFAAQIEALASKAGVLLVSTGYLSVEEALPPETDAPVAAPVEGEEGDAAEAPVAEADASSPTDVQAVPSVPGLVAVAVTIRVAGEPAALHSFLETAQTGVRVLSMSSIIYDPATDGGEFEMKIDGYVYVLPGTDVSTLNVDAGADGTTVN
ncbi:hypothetical protein D9C83_03380 [Salinibacterium amurskyense]|nr:hypothetical protein D9C83_03380 [Salinibacterium amurskyense]